MDNRVQNRTFRPTQENQERLKFAESLDLNVSEVINEALSESAKRIIERKVRRLREALSVPVP
jgi:hypothetical protein